MNTATLRKQAIQRLDALVPRCGGKMATLRFVASFGDVSAASLNQFWSGFRPNPLADRLDEILRQIDEAEAAADKAA